MTLFLSGFAAGFVVALLAVVLVGRIATRNLE